MGVSRLDTFPLLVNRTGNTTGAANTTGGTEAPLTSYPVNGIVSVHGFGTFGTGTLAVEVTPDGTNWVPAVTTPTGLTANGVLTWQGVAMGIRAKLTGVAGTTVNATAVFVDY